MFKLYLSQTRVHVACKRHGFLCFCRRYQNGLDKSFSLPSPAQQLGFSLIELLVIVSLLAILATIALTALDFTTQAGGKDIGRPLAQSEMVEIAKSVRQFKQDVGVYPPIQHPTDLRALNYYVDADDDGFDDVYGMEPWDIDTNIGWRGPYLERKAFAFIEVTGIHTEVASTASGIRFYAKADPFTVSKNNGFNWFSCESNADCNEALTNQGAPYLLLGFIDINGDGIIADVDTDGDGDLDNPDNLPRRIISLGADGQYGGINATDACIPNTTDAGEDDLVLCI